MIVPSRARRLPLVGMVPKAIGAVSLLWGAFVAWRYHELGLTLSHYDARGHLVVARRIFDSITPGWQQIGAVWLPLPHLLNAIPVQIDFFYRTGASAVAISIASFALATGAIAWIVMMLTGSALAAAAGAAVYALNPNVLYLQATPMTEPLLLGLTTLAVAMLIDWCRDAARRSHAVGVAFALACLTRYEAWPVTGAALVLAVWARWRAGDALLVAIRRVARIALYPALTVLAFMVFSRMVVGEWFVSSGFFVPENTALGHPMEAVDQIAWGARTLSGYWLLVVAGAGFAVIAVRGLLDKRRGELLIAASLAATAAVPWAAFVKGHPYRIRYMVPLIVAEAIGAGVAAGVWKKGRALTVVANIAVVAVITIVALELRPLDVNAPMVAEAKWDLPNIAVRQHVTDCLRAGYDGQTIMASMGSLGHYMQDASHTGFGLRDFLHEGNGDIWLAALDDPRPFAGWILIEEKAEGGDMLAIKARENPAFLGGFSRVCDGAGLALYRRKAAAAAGLQKPMFSVSR